MENNPRITILILTWNGLEDTIKCLESVKKLAYHNFDVVVVDNHSDKPENEILKEKFGDMIEVLRTDKNLGYAGGNNQGIKYILDHKKSDYIFIINNDTILQSEVLKNLISCIDEKTGVCGPKINYYHDKNKIQSLGGKINFYSGKFKDIKEDRKECFDVDYIVGAAMLVKTEAIRDLGLFKEEYFTYVEDVELCTRIKKAGFRVVSCPKAVIWHKEYASQKNSENTDYYLTRNRLKFMKEHANLMQKIIFSIYFYFFTVPKRILYHEYIESLIKAIKDA